MADPVSVIGLSLAVLTTFKEAYLLSKYVWTTIQSAKHHKSERFVLETEYKHELLYLCSLGRLHQKHDIFFADELLQQAWLEHVRDVFECLSSEVFGQYAKLAAKEDPDYRQYSPFSNRATAPSRTIDFSLTIEDPRGVPREKPRPDESSWDFGWALSRKKKLEYLVKAFQKWTGILKELMPLKDLMQRATPGQMVDRLKSSPSFLQAFVADEDAQRAGLATHARLRQLTHNVVTEQRDLNIPRGLLETTDDDLVLVPGTLADTIRTSSGHSRTIDRKVLVEYKYHNGPSVESQVHQLVSLLSSAGDSDLRTLQCKGYVDELDDEGRYAFVFSYPDDTDLSVPISLNEVLRGTTTHPRLSLPDRFHVAQAIANSVSVLHADGWVHKSIRSHSIVFFERRDGPLTYDRSFLVDFEYSRPENGDTLLESDEDEQRNLYRHPARQHTPTESFTKIHDIYALGVVLLEIGLWQTASEIQEHAIRKLGRASVVGEWKLKKVYIEAAETGLFHQMGPAYSEAVLTCLRGDLGDATVQSDLQLLALGGDPQTATGRADFGMVFYQKVVEMLDPCRLLK